MTVNANLYARFREKFPSDPGTELLRDESGRSVSWEEAEAMSARMANLLKGLGATPGDRVTVQVEKSVENLFLYLACLRAGLVYHPLNTAYTASELEYFLADAQPAVVVCDPQALDTFRALLQDGNGSSPAQLTLGAEGSGTLVSEAAAREPVQEPIACDGSDLAALLYSSGTTGKPKGIMLSHDNLYHNAETLVDAWGFTSGDRLLHLLPVYHVHGLFVALHCVLLSGASMVWHNRFVAENAMADLAGCTVMMGVPTYYTRLLAQPGFDAEHCATMRLFVSGSAPLLAETFEEFRTRTGHTILERYGMTETGMNTSNPLDGERRAGTVGFPLPGVALRIVDEAGDPVPSGEPGNLQVKGPNVFKGYWRQPEKTAEDFTSDGFFNTGDKASMDEDGYVAIVGRAKDMIISGGLNVYPKEIELVLDELPGVVESAVIGVPHPDFGEAVVAVLVVEGEPPAAEGVIAHCRAQLANFKVPKRVEVVDALPRNAMGKVQKNVLRQRFSG